MLVVWSGARGGGIRFRWGHGGPHDDEICVLIRRKTWEFPFSITKKGYSKKVTVYKSGRRFSPRIRLTGILILSFPTSRTASSLYTFVIGAKADCERAHIIFFSISIRNVILFACHRHLPLLSATNLDSVASSGKSSNMSIQWPAWLIKHSLTVVMRVAWPSLLDGTSAIKLQPRHIVGFDTMQINGNFHYSFRAFNLKK